MTISEQTLETLEFPKIRAQLARHTSFSASRELVLALEPGNDIQVITRRLHLTSEARRLLDEQDEATIGGARDVRESAGLAARGGILEANTFLEIANTLHSMRRLRTLLLKGDPAVFPLLQELAADLPQLPSLEEEIERIIGEDGAVKDTASPALGRLRREIRIAAGRLQDRLHSMVTSTQYAGVLQEAIVTVRNGRYVLPVKATHRRSIPGLVHDQSASGATLYVEPMAVVELNNQLREAQLAEEQEVKRILAELSEHVGRVADTIIVGVEALSVIDLHFAQAKYSLALRCIEPVMVENSKPCTSHPEPDSHSAAILLTGARHPLLDQKTVVPIDVWLGGDFQLLLITGPNTGGKTVALKTVGLLALMSQAGMHIPASEPSHLPVFDQIFADIGDEQSIEQSLSTFSSHMTNIIRILRAIESEQPDGASSKWYSAAESTQTEATESLSPQPLPPDSHPTTLVLLDELGAGTDPVEGAALARAICRRLLERGCLGICTTHYAELKAFAYNTPGIQNASVEFDVETLAPTYKLTIGLPGRSNALAIAARLGLDAELIEEARNTMAREEVQLEGLLATIHREREEVATTLQRAEEIRADAEKYRERYRDSQQELEATIQDRINAVAQEFEQELELLRSEMRRMREESRSATLARQWSQEAEQRIRELQEQANLTGRRILAASTTSATEQATEPDGTPRPLRVGDTVLVPSVGLQGEILSIDEEDQTADVQVGGFRMHVDLYELRREKRKAREKDEPVTSSRPAPTRTVRLPETPDVSMTFDMRGWRAADVTNKLDRYLNDAYLSGFSQVRLIHGKGSGVLRQIVRGMLQGHPLVKSFTGGGSDGGEGVTIAKLMER